MSAIATMLVWLGFAVLGYGVGRWHEQILASRPRMPEAPAVHNHREQSVARAKALAESHRARRAQGLPCLHEWMSLPHDPPGYRAPCLWCDALKPLEPEP